MELVYTDQQIIRSIFHALRNAVVEFGYYPDISNYGDTPQDLAQFKLALKSIESSKGFYIEVFSESSARNKGKKDAPRIVVVLGRSYPGQIGSNPNSVERLPNSDNYQRVSLPSLATNIQVEIYLVAGTSKQHYTLNAIKDLALGERSFVKPYDDPDGIPFMVFQSGYYDLDDPMENIIERSYVYTVPDVFRGPTKVEKTNIKPINTIDVDIEPTKDNIHVSNNN